MRSDVAPHVAVRPYAPDDLPLVEQIVSGAFDRPLAPPLAKRVALATTRAFVAEYDGIAGGFATLSLYGKVAYLGSMAVDPQLQRRGLGNALMAAMIDYARESGLEAITLDATDAGVSLYSKFGFIQNDRTIVLVRESPFSMTLGRARERRELSRAISFDRSLLGCDRAEVLTMLSNEDGAATIAERDGYGIAWSGRIGPLVARSPQAARAILTRLVRDNEPITRMLVPESTPMALEIAAEHGFKIARVVAHMSHGKTPFTQPCIFARASHSHG